MKICVAQTKPVRGNIQANIYQHKKLIDIAVSGKADMIIFPELSLTGYEPKLAEELATNKNEKCFEDFQKISNNKNIIIGVGMPLKSDKDIFVSMIIFQPDTPTQVYSKKYLHADEESYFTSGVNTTNIISADVKVATAICYEVSVTEHAATAFKNGAKIYIASVAKISCRY
jgi:predicted amidohydrolase